MKIIEEDRVYGKPVPFRTIECGQCFRRNVEDQGCVWMKINNSEAFNCIALHATSNNIVTTATLDDCFYLLNATITVSVV